MKYTFEGKNDEYGEGWSDVNLLKYKERVNVYEEVGQNILV